MRESRARYMAKMAVLNEFIGKTVTSIKPSKSFLSVTISFDDGSSLNVKPNMTGSELIISESFSKNSKKAHDYTPERNMTMEQKRLREECNKAHETAKKFERLSPTPPNKLIEAQKCKAHVFKGRSIINPAQVTYDSLKTENKELDDIIRKFTQIDPQKFRDMILNMFGLDDMPVETKLGKPRPLTTEEALRKEGKRKEDERRARAKVESYCRAGTEQSYREITHPSEIGKYRYQVYLTRGGLMGEPNWTDVDINTNIWADSPTQAIKKWAELHGYNDPKYLDLKSSTFFGWTITVNRLG